MSLEPDIWPDGAGITAGGQLTVGGCPLVDLAEAYATPLYVFDEGDIRAAAGRARRALGLSYPGEALVCYAAKAYCAPWILTVLADEGLGLDVVSGGELYTAAQAGFPRDRIYFHGNNKGEDELGLALAEGVGRVVVDNLDEIERLGRLAARRVTRQPVLLRVGPGVDAHTHSHLHTGGSDTKFGLGIASGQAAEGVRATLAQPALELRGFHAHIGSQIATIDPYRDAVERLFAFAAEMRAVNGVPLREISPGGGFGIRYTPDDPPVAPEWMIGQVGVLVEAAARNYGFTDPRPRLTIEPGRSIVARSAVALYRVGSTKSLPCGRTYVAVDGGMADNIRAAAYGAKYTAVLANRVGNGADGETEVAIAGKYCESGDVLVPRVVLPHPRGGDLVAIPMAGAYQLSMASNYNMALRPAVVVVAGGQARLVRRRETYADLLAAEVLEQSPAARGDPEWKPLEQQSS
ncbi:MAG: diaminopimelate decarboxylase [Acidimicrobiales bacterium]